MGQEIVSPASVWVEETYHNVLPGEVTSPKVPGQIGKKTLLQRITEKANTFFAGIHLPTVNMEHSVGTVEGGTKTMMYVAIGVIALFALNRKN